MRRPHWHVEAWAAMPESAFPKLPPMPVPSSLFVMMKIESEAALDMAKSMGIIVEKNHRPPDGEWPESNHG